MVGQRHYETANIFHAVEHQIQSLKQTIGCTAEHTASFVQLILSEASTLNSDPPTTNS